MRLSYGDNDNDGSINSNSEIIEENNYYPFGLKHKGYNSIVTSTNPGQKRLFNGKELQNENIGGVQLNLYDYGARNYDPALGRWMNIDPLAEISHNLSLYNYVKNNPLRLVDPSGMIWKDQNEADKLKEEIEDTKKSISRSKANDEERLSKGGLSERKINRINKRIVDYDSRLKSLDSSIKNIDALGKDQTHTFDLVSGNDGRNHVSKGDDGVINIQGPNSALKIHELTHAALSLKNPKGLRFSTDGLLLSNYPGGFIDEIQGLFGSVCVFS